VDDDPDVLVLIQTILSGAKYRVLTALGRAEAVRLAEQKHVHIDAVLLDVRIPGVTGGELAEEILAIRPHVRVLWMSGFVDEEFIRIRLVEGHVGFLPKPLQQTDLLRAVEQAIEGHGAARTLRAGGAGA